jgi:phenylalanyl-tRNA synthetase alpha chain
MSSILDSIKDNISQLEESFSQEMAKAKELRQSPMVEALRVKYLGKKSLLMDLLASLGKLDKADKPLAGQMINKLKSRIESEIQQLLIESDAWTMEALLAGEAVDPSLPTNSLQLKGALHPVTLMYERLVEAFHRMGFAVHDGPEIELDYYNFAALNFPSHHPARDMQDTFHLTGKIPLLLRTHTSAVQVHAMLAEKPPLKIIAPGRVFRCDSDLTHTPMFHQLEGFVVDEKIRMSDLKGSIEVLLQAIFGEQTRTRLRPSFFPFVEPGAELDMQCQECQGSGCRVCKQTGWLEIGGCGMIHPNVFESVGIDSDRYTGFAFGFGIDRLALLKFRLQDLRQLFESEYDFLQQFPVTQF